MNNPPMHRPVTVAQFEPRNFRDNGTGKYGADLYFHFNHNGRDLQIYVKDAEVVVSKKGGDDRRHDPTYWVPFNHLNAPGLWNWLQDGNPNYQARRGKSPRNISSLPRRSKRRSIR